MEGGESMSRIAGVLAAFLLVCTALVAPAQVPESAAAGQGDARAGSSAQSQPDASQTGDTDSRQRRGTRRSARLRPGRTSVTLLDQKISITFGPLKVSGQDYAHLESLTAGDVVPFVESFAIKLLTDADLDFGGTVVKAHNVSPDYPGVYSLWLKKVAGGWSLVFNREADVWGTMHDPEADTAEVPLQFATPAEPGEKLVAELSEGDGLAKLRIAWGSYEWTTEALPVD